MSALDDIAKQPFKGASEAAEGAQGLKVPLPLLFMLLMLLVIMAVFDILKKSYDVHEEANYRVAKAALEITLSRTQSGLNGIASRVAAEHRGFDETLPPVFFTNDAPAIEDLSSRTLFLAFDRDHRLVKARVGPQMLDAAALSLLVSQPAFSRLFSATAAERRRAGPLVAMVDGVSFILSDPQALASSDGTDGATHVAVALPARELLFDELEKYEVFGSGQLKNYLNQKNDLSSLTDLIVGLQKRDYAQFHFSAVAQIVIVLAAFVIAVMIGHHIDRKNDALRQSRDEILDREQEGQRLRLAAEQASRTKSLFIQNMSHELRTPLNAVIGFSEIIENQKLGPLDSEYRDCAVEIRESGNNLLALINDLLDLSRIESGTEVLVDEEIDVQELAQAVLRRIGALAARAGVSLEMDVDISLPRLYSDGRKVKQLLVHLLSNAIKFTPEGGRAMLSVRQGADGGFNFEVSDTGVGMDPEEKAKALTLFSQLDDSLNRRHDGSGLGLPLTKSSVELLGGSFDLQSEVGVGTTVTVCLPDRRAAAESAA